MHTHTLSPLKAFSWLQLMLSIHQFQLASQFQPLPPISLSALHRPAHQCLSGCIKKATEMDRQLKRIAPEIW